MSALSLNDVSGSTAQSWLLLRPTQNAILGMPAHFAAELHFHVIEVEPTTGEIEGDEDGFAEEYPLEDIEIATADFLTTVCWLDITSI